MEKGWTHHADSFRINWVGNDVAILSNILDHFCQSKPFNLLAFKVGKRVVGEVEQHSTLFQLRDEQVLPFANRNFFKQRQLLDISILCESKRVARHFLVLDRLLTIHIGRHFNKRCLWRMFADHWRHFLQRRAYLVARLTHTVLLRWAAVRRRAHLHFDAGSLSTAIAGARFCLVVTRFLTGWGVAGRRCWTSRRLNTKKLTNKLCYSKEL